VSGKARRAVIVGVADAPLRDGKLATAATPLGAQAMVAAEALNDVGLSMRDVDGLFTTGGWGIPGTGQFQTASLAEYLGIDPRFADGTNVGGASFEVYLGHALTAIEAGRCDVALISYGSTQRSGARTLGSWSLPTFNGQYDVPFGLPAPIGGYALAATRYLHETGGTSEQLAEVAVAAREWAALNPAATKREPITAQDVLESPLVCDPLHTLDCCLVTDGAGAVVVTTAERARDLARPPVEIRGWAESQTHWSISQMPDLLSTGATRTGPAALAEAGMTLGDIDLLQIYDSFTITVLLTLESLGVCKRGEAGAFIADGHTRPGGSLPMNTSGGGLAAAHPGMYGIFLIIEACRQLWNECGQRQVPHARTALVHGTGGQFSSSATCVLSMEHP
jgi:acetyl-CoA acetyltransferase